MRCVVERFVGRELKSSAVIGFYDGNRFGAEIFGKIVISVNPYGNFIFAGIENFEAAGIENFAVVAVIENFAVVAGIENFAVVAVIVCGLQRLVVIGPVKFRAYSVC